MRAAEPRQRLVISALFIVLVENGRLGVEPGQQFTRLPVDVRLVVVAASQHELARQVTGDQEPGLLVGVNQHGGAPRAGPWPEPVPMSVNFAADVTVAGAVGLDDEP